MKSSTFLLEPSHGPDADADGLGEAGLGHHGTTDAGLHGQGVSQMLSDRAGAKALAAERPEPPTAPGLVTRLFHWLREQMERLVERPPPLSAARPEDGSRADNAKRARAAAAESERDERDLAGQLITAARTATRQWGNTTPATDTLISAAASISGQRKTPTAQQAVLEQINRGTAPLVSRSTEAVGLRGRCRDERQAAADAAAMALDDQKAGTRASRTAEPAKRSRPLVASCSASSGRPWSPSWSRLCRGHGYPAEPARPRRRGHAVHDAPPAGALRSDGEVERPVEGHRRTKLIR